jgi:hypothetical protein
MRNPKELTRAEIIRTASTFRSTRKMSKWRVRIDNRELPARPLVLAAAGVPPNDPTNSHQAVAILKQLGFETSYAGHGEGGELSPPSAPESSITDLVAHIRSGVPDREWRRLPRDLATNVDHYLYGSPKREK